MTRQPFNQQRGGQRKRTLAEVKRTITELSGGAVKELLKALFESQFGQQAVDGVKNASYKLQSLVECIKNQYKNTLNFNKRQWSSLVSPILTKKELKLMGWNLSSKVSFYLF